MIRTRIRWTVGALVILGASVTSIAALPPPPAQAPPRHRAPRLVAPPQGPPFFAWIDGSAGDPIVVDPAAIDPRIVISQTRDIDPRIVVTMSADIDPGIFGSRENDRNRR